ncbi:MerR family transcriptional regulator [Streptomyces sp. NPDC057854]|uniref:MerR family transcriptional regulator n=1 Tax=unclassified Streptomyces TaxID=2593676 RepID=UPI00367C1A3D
MSPSELMPIGVFARRTGLTASALRFYADSGLLPPAEVDPVTGYRSYAAGQEERAGVLRRLREIGMPLADVRAVLDGSPGEAARMIDAHVARVVGEAADVRRKAAVLTANLTAGLAPACAPGDAGRLPVAALRGPVLADAVEQVLTATVREPGLPVLGGLRVEAAPGAVSLTATDRYRLATRTLVPVEAGAGTWAATVDGDALRAAVPDVRRSPLVRVEATPYGLWLRMPEREDRHCPLLADDFPDHRLMLASLPGATTRVTVAKGRLLRALEEQPEPCVTLRVSPGVLDVSGVSLDAVTTGRELRIRFALTTLHPAVSTALGPDVMLDLRGPDRPVTVRSADRGDLTTLAMPVHDRES